MKVGSESSAGVTTVTGERKTGEAARRTGDAGASSTDPASATVKLSDAATSLLSTASGDETESFDAEKVQRIAQAIREGRFQINPEKIADRLLANAREVLDRGSSH